MSRSNICSAPNCINRGKSRPFIDIPMFRVPKDPIRAKEWIKHCGRKELFSKDPLYLYDNIRLCALHFEDSQFMNNKKNRLIRSAVPTLFNESAMPKIDISSIESIDYQSFVNQSNIQKSNQTLALKKLSPLVKEPILLRHVISDDKRTFLTLEDAGCQSLKKNKIETKVNIGENLINKLKKSLSPRLTFIRQDIRNQSSNKQAKVKHVVVNTKVSEAEKNLSQNEIYMAKIHCPNKSLGKLLSLPNNSIINHNQVGLADIQKGSHDLGISAKVKITKNLTNKGDGQVIKYACSANSIDTEGTKNLDYDVDLFVNEEQHLASLTDSKETVKPDCKKPGSKLRPTRGNKDQSLGICEEAIVATSSTDAADTQRNEESQVEEILNHCYELSTRVTTGQPSAIDVLVKGDQLVKESINEAGMQDNIDQSLKDVSKIEGKTKPAYEAEAQVSYNKPPEHKNEKDTNFTCNVESHENQVDFIETNIRFNETVNVPDETNTQTKQKLITEFGASRQLSSEEQKNKLEGIKSSKESILSKNMYQILSGSSLLLKKKVMHPKVVKRKLPTPIMGPGKKICLETSLGPLKREFNLSDKNECLVLSSSVEAFDVKKSCPKQISENVQENPTSNIIVCGSSSENKVTEVVNHLTGKAKPLKIGQQIQRKSLIKINLSSLNQVKKKRTLNFKVKGHSLIKTPRSSDNSLLLSNDFFKYKKRVEEFKQKLLSPDFKPVNITTNKVCETHQHLVPVCPNKTKVGSLTDLSSRGNSQIKSDIQQINFTSSVGTTLNPFGNHNVEVVKSPQRTQLTDIMSKDLTNYKKKLVAYEKTIDRLKTELKTKYENLKKDIKEVRRRNSRKDFLIRKLRNERKQLKQFALSVEPQTKPNYQRDRPFIEHILSKYMNKDTLSIVMSQIKKPTNAKNRWSTDVKMFALNIFQTSSKAYRVLCSYLSLPSERTLQKFLKEADIMSLSGVNCDQFHDSSQDSEGDGDDSEFSDFVFSPVETDIECRLDKDLPTSTGEVNHEIIWNDPEQLNSSVVEVECEVQNELKPLCSEEETDGQRFSMVEIPNGEWVQVETSVV